MCVSIVSSKGLRMQDPINPPSTDARKNLPDASPLKQQQIPAWNPAFQRDYVSFCLGMVAVMFIPIGAILLIAYENTPELIIDYGKLQKCRYEDNIMRRVNNYTLPEGCPPFNVSFTLSTTFKAPVTLYYRLSGFHQNYRFYANSRSDTQMYGEEEPSPGTLKKSCSPYDTIGTYAIHPCGALAWSMFNDSFRLFQLTTDQQNRTSHTLVCDTARLEGMSCRKRGIAWSSDVDRRFRPIPANRPMTVGYGGVPTERNNSWVQKGWYENEVGHRIPSMQDEDLMVWMRVAAKSTFQKKLRYIDIDLLPGAYLLEVTQRYPLSEKAILVTSETWLGPKDMTNGVAFEVIGALCLVWAVGLLIQQWVTHKTAASTRGGWGRKHAPGMGHREMQSLV